MMRHLANCKGIPKLPSSTEILAANPDAADAKAGNANAGAVVRTESKEQKKPKVNIFGDENFGCITGLHILGFLEGSSGAVSMMAAKSLIGTVAGKMFAGNPENLTCFISKKNIMVHTLDGWKVQIRPTVAETIVRRVSDLLYAQQPWPGKDGVDAYCPNLTEKTQLLKFIWDNVATLATSMSSILDLLQNNTVELEKYLGKLPAIDDKNPNDYKPKPEKKVEQFAPAGAFKSKDFKPFSVQQIRDDVLKKFPLPAAITHEYIRKVLHRIAELFGADESNYTIAVKRAAAKCYDCDSEKDIFKKADDRAKLLEICKTFEKNPDEFLKDMHV
jgi:hypothetical protein